MRFPNTLNNLVSAVLVSLKMPVGRRKDSLLVTPLYQHSSLLLGLVLHSIIVSALAQNSGSASGSGFLAISSENYDSSGEEVLSSASGDFGMHACVVKSTVSIILNHK